jgi:hypothetical protein
MEPQYALDIMTQPDARIVFRHYRPFRAQVRAR